MPVKGSDKEWLEGSEDKECVLGVVVKNHDFLLNENGKGGVAHKSWLAPFPRLSIIYNMIHS